MRPATAEDEAGVRERQPEVFAEETKEEAVVEELEPHEFRYDQDGTHHRRLGEGEVARLNEDHLSAHGRQAAMERIAAALDRANEEPLQERVATTTNNNNRNNNNNNRIRKELSNPITVNAMREGVVAEDVYGRYVNEIIHSWIGCTKTKWTELQRMIKPSTAKPMWY